MMEARYPRPNMMETEEGSALNIAVAKYFRDLDYHMFVCVVKFFRIAPCVYQCSVIINQQYTTECIVYNTPTNVCVFMEHKFYYWMESLKGSTK